MVHSFFLPVISLLYQYGCTDASCRFSSDSDSLRIASEGLNISLHPSQSCQLIQETPVSLSVFISSALEQEKSRHLVGILRKSFNFRKNHETISMILWISLFKMCDRNVMRNTIPYLRNPRMPRRY